MHAAYQPCGCGTTQANQVGSQFPLGSVCESGTYVCNWSGHLIRMTDPNHPWGGNPFFNIVSNEPLYLTKISDDPFVPVSKARQIAASLDCPVNF